MAILREQSRGIECLRPVHLPEGLPKNRWRNPEVCTGARVMMDTVYLLPAWPTLHLAASPGRLVMKKP